MRENWKSHPLYPPLLLGTVTLLASASLAWAARATQAAIQQAEARDLRDSLVQVLPAGFADNDPAADSATVDIGGVAPLTVYRARRDGAVRGAMFGVSGKGYGGEIKILMGVDRAGAVLGVRILGHTETPGLGDKIEVAKSDWVERFAGKALATSTWAVRKDGGDFDQFTGATITPRAVVRAIREGLETFARHKAEILDERHGGDARAAGRDRETSS
ncbi:MAG: RnfABCDGE type electron transport complex subunit G [Azoarcus sp.]|jgi:electron transport complex protein RnfG|nr:RnfABCDGE type electron transport complex subunit G [Azoarcus sp.]